MNYVSEDVSRCCREWEQRFKSLPSQAGVLFVSVKSPPSPKGASGKFHVVLGINRDLPVDESTGLGIITKVLEKELQSGLYDIDATVYLGK